MNEQTHPLKRAHKPRIAVVFGGRSSEHAISCLTAGSVLRAIDRDVYDVVPVGITTSGRWVIAPDDPDALAITEAGLPSVQDMGSEVLLASTQELVVAEPATLARALGRVDVVFPLLHGPYGEDGTLQGLLEMADVRYVGSGVLASAVGMDKHYMKLVLAGSGLPIGRYAVVMPGEWKEDPSAVIETAASLRWPVFVKPARGGSSIGISKVASADELPAAMDEALRWDPKVVIEEFVPGREVECGVLTGRAGGAPDTTRPAEVRVAEGRDFYDFEAKYLGEQGTVIELPADLPEHVALEVRQLAAKAFTALSCEGLARVDFFLRSDDRVVINEVNTMPGFTPTSMFPMMWQDSGVDYPALVDRLLRAALGRPTGLR